MTDWDPTRQGRPSRYRIYVLTYVRFNTRKTYKERHEFLLIGVSKLLTSKQGKTIADITKEYGNKL